MRRSIEPSDELDRLAQELKGNTLTIYWYMLRRNKPLGVREIQRSLNLSSSSLALHHLNKLIELNLVERDRYGSFQVSRRVNPGLLGFFVGAGRLFLPRFILYAVFYTGLLISSLVFFYGQMDATSVILYMSLTISSIIFWVEANKLWKSQPF